MKILIVLTSHDQLGDTGEQTGFWLEEFAAPTTRSGCRRRGGTGFAQAASRPRSESDQPDAQTEATERFNGDGEAQTLLANTYRLDQVSAEDFDAVFYPGGHGPLWDLVNNPTSIALIESFVKSDKPVGAVCHAPAALTEVRGKDGEYLVKGKRVTGFTNGEEAVELTEVVPFLLEDRLRERGGQYSKGADWTPYVQVDGLLVTGQNPASSEAAAQELLKLLRAG